MLVVFKQGLKSDIRRQLLFKEENELSLVNWHLNNWVALFESDLAYSQNWGQQDSLALENIGVIAAFIKYAILLICKNNKKYFNIYIFFKLKHVKKRAREDKSSGICDAVFVKLTYQSGCMAVAATLSVSSPGVCQRFLMMFYSSSASSMTIIVHKGEHCQKAVTWGSCDCKVRGISLW